MIEKHFCPILIAAENISGNEVDCARKRECKRATNCVLYAQYGNWDALTEHFVKLANVTVKREKVAIDNAET